MADDETLAEVTAARQVIGLHKMHYPSTVTTHSHGLFDSQAT